MIKTNGLELHSQSFKTKVEGESAMYVEHVLWVSPIGEKHIWCVVIKARIYIGTIWGKLPQKNILRFKEPLI